jgi:hypothetical protein
VDDHADALEKFKKILKRCDEKGIVLKMKKSFIGTDTVTFFGYKVTHGAWELSEDRKKAIDDIPFPSNTKDMQSFLGAALFFHHHIPDYSEWSAKLYEMTHDGFNWDPGTWTFDYEAHFQKFKEALKNAATLFFPDYSLPWFIRCDASQYAVGTVLFQIFTTPDGEKINQPIAFASKRFSKPASNWDAFKREAYGLYFSIHTFSFYLRGKFFTLETDHRNLQWIESNESPIVIRWRALMQSFVFVILHIPGKINRVADFMSRAGAPLVVLGLYFSTIGSNLLSMGRISSHSRPTVRLWNSQISEPRSPSPPLALAAKRGEQNKYFLQKMEQMIDSSKSSEGISFLALGATVADVNLSQSVLFELVMAQVHGGRNMHFGAY